LCQTTCGVTAAATDVAGGMMDKPLYEKYADDFASSRPGYPYDIKAFLFDHFSINPKSVVADIACGTGIFTQLLSCRPDVGLVVGVDRSRALLGAGTRFYGDFCFEPVCALGETAPLKSNSIDMVTVAQSFHWMQRKKTLGELVRILRRGGGLALVWYRRKDLTLPHEKFIEDLTHRYNPNYDPTFMDSDYEDILLADGNFCEIDSRQFWDFKTFDLDLYLKWQRSKSFIGDAMESDELDEFLGRVKTGILKFFPNGIITEEFTYDLIYARKK
jgi:ubiquinone/menaquinone biosynthesis C-methylase UbiE